MIKDLAGIGSLEKALTETNALLADVLTELKETNSERLESIATALQVLNRNVEQSASIRD